MIEMSITTSGNVTAYLEGVQDRLGNLAPLGQEIATVIEEGNRQGLLAGLDKDGVPLIPTKKPTGGEPLTPHGAASRVVTHFEALVEVTGNGQVEVVAGWDLPWLQYHTTGTSHLPRRDIEGIRQDTMVNVMTHVDVFTGKVLNG